MVIYIHHKKISERALAQLDDFVSKGGGILGVHSATASFQGQLHYFEILGGRFIGHGPVASFEVKPVPESELFAGIPVFNVKDELYIHELQPGITPHFTATHEGQEVPIVWTYHYGQGRVCYAVPGHRTETMQNETYQKILQRGLAWVCGDMTKLNLGIVGCGDIAGYTAWISRLVPQVRLSACCDVNAERVQTFAKRHRIPQTYTDYAEMLDESRSRCRLPGCAAQLALRDDPVRCRGGETRLRGETPHAHAIRRDSSSSKRWQAKRSV